MNRRVDAALSTGDWLFFIATGIALFVMLRVHGAPLWLAVIAPPIVALLAIANHNAATGESDEAEHDAD